VGEDAVAGGVTLLLLLLVGIDRVVGVLLLFVVMVGIVGVLAGDVIFNEGALGDVGIIPPTLVGIIPPPPSSIGGGSVMGDVI
jgi:hypothetical protein